ncbi:MAG: DegT/DnrJ/EryC1/StrS family aminotransferase [Desulfobacteraceae bacterium]|nr:DegT/DnrJ/EryC1/StrS family aminotransferase [Desulfobacteraceae bacterium]
MQFIDLSAQQKRIRDKIEARINQVLDHGQYILGPEVDELEKKLTAFVGVNHCISCSSGTDALLIALMALDIGPGDEVITIPYTWISTAEVIALLHAKPVFVDIQPNTFNMDPDRIEEAITPHTKAIMPVSIYGQCADMTRINAIAAKHNIPVIEDGAQSFGATHYGQKSCGLSTIGCTSFFPSKPLGCYGDGGAIFSNDDHLVEKMRQIHVHGQKVKHQHPLVGINGRLDTMQAAILLEKLEIFPEECRLRWEAGQRYNELLSGIPGIQVPVIAEGNDSVYAQYTLLTEEREKLSNRLKGEGIPSVAYYAVPLHLQGAFADLGHKPGDYPVAEHVAARGLSLPMYPYISREDQGRIAEIMGGRLEV